MVNESRRLSTGSSVGARILGVVFCLVFAGFGVAFAAVVLFMETVGDPFGGSSVCMTSGDLGDLPPDLVPSDLTECGGWLPDGIGAVGIIGLLVGGLFALIGLLGVVAALRGTAAWLDGAKLRVRSTFRTRTVDLSTADVTAGIVTHTHTSDEGRTRSRRVPTLVARDPASGRKVTLSLQGTSLDRIPPVELRALADAITVGRPESDVDAYRVAQQLREMADNPLELNG
ncbi:hypothetical protein [Actinoplanes regularis]|nr:hypothetical protein [Actinoplanes regularis]